MISPLIQEDDVARLETLASSKFDQAARELIGNYEYTKLIAEGSRQPSQIVARLREMMKQAKAPRSIFPVVLGQDAASQSNI